MSALHNVPGRSCTLIHQPLLPCYQPGLPPLQLRHSKCTSCQHPLLRQAHTSPRPHGRRTSSRSMAAFTVPHFPQIPTHWCSTLPVGYQRPGTGASLRDSVTVICLSILSPYQPISSAILRHWLQYTTAQYHLQINPSCSSF